MGHAGTQFADGGEPFAPGLLQAATFFLQGALGLIEFASEREDSDQDHDDRGNQVALMPRAALQVALMCLQKFVAKRVADTLDKPELLAPPMSCLRRTVR